MDRGPERIVTALEEVAFQSRDPLPAEVEVLRLEEILFRPMEHVITRPQRIHFHALLLIEAGQSSHEIDFETYPVGPGHLLVVPSMHVQAFAPERTIQGYITVFTPAFLERCHVDIREAGEACRVLFGAGPRVRLADTSFQRAREATHALASLGRVPPSRFASQAIQAAFSLLVFALAGMPELVASAEANQPQDPLVARFLTQLEDHFVSEHQASFYAKTLHVSLRTLDRRLVAARNETTRQAIAARLVLESKRLLTRRETLVKDIAYQLGFSEPQNFTRFFRSQTTFSPEAFRQKLDD